MGNVSSMTQIPGPGGHQMLPAQHGPSTTHMTSRIGQQPDISTNSGVPPAPGVQGPLRGPPAGHMNIPQAPTAVQISQHVTPANNLSSQPTGPIQMSAGGGTPQHSQIPIPTTARQYPPAQMELPRQQNDTLKSEDTAELISFD